MKNKYVILSIVVIMLGLIVSAGTYAYLTLAANVTEGNYAGNTTCFNIDYSVGDGDITGTLFPSMDASGGLNGYVSINVNSACSVSGKGTLIMHVNNETTATFGTKATPRCESKITGEVLSSITTESACTATTANVWRYPDSYCEDKDTLTYLKEYRTRGTCEANNGTWTTNGSALKYAVYSNSNMTGEPLVVGHFDTATIGTDIVLKDNIILTNEVRKLYISVWLDGNLADNTFTDLPFSAYVRATAIQTKRTLPDDYQEVEYLETLGAQYVDTGFVFSNNTDISTKFRTPPTITTSGSTVLFFSGTSAITYGFAISSSAASGKYRLFRTNAANGSEMLATLTDYTLDYTGLNVYMNDALVHTFASRVFTTPYTMPLFAQYYNNDTSPINYAKSGTRLYYFKIYENGDMVRNLIPAYEKSGGRTSGVRGLYDTVTNTFYTNRGSGTFDIGPDV